MPQGKQPSFVADKALDPDDVMSGAGHFLSVLSSADRLAFFGATVMFLACFFPWKETVQDGEVLGLMSSGLLVFGLSLCALAAIVVRVRNSMPTLSPLISWVLQLATLGVSEVWCLIYLTLAWDSTPVRSPIGNFEMWASSPSLGLFLALAGGAAAIVGTVFGLRSSSS